MSQAFKAMTVTIGLLVGVIILLEAVTWLLPSTVTENIFPVAQHRAQFSILMDTPQPIVLFRSALT
jgi:hypothetical protein